MGLGSDVAGGYRIDIMTAMRQAVIMSRTRQGAQIEAHVQQGQTSASDGISKTVHWIDTLYLATRGGAEALGLQTGTFTVGTPFDAQLSVSIDMHSCLDSS